RLNSAFASCSYGLLGTANAGDFQAFPIIVHAALLHTGENFSQADVTRAIEDLCAQEAITFDEFQRISNEVVTESFYYKPTVHKMMNQNPEMKKAYEQLMA